MLWMLLLLGCFQGSSEAPADPTPAAHDSPQGPPVSDDLSLPDDYVLPDGSTLLLRTVDVRAQPHPSWRTRWMKDAAPLGEIDGFAAYLPELGAVRLRLVPVPATLKRCPDERDPDGTREVHAFHVSIERDDGAYTEVPLLPEPDGVVGVAGDLHARVHLDAFVGPYVLITTHLYSRTCDRDDGSTAARQVRLDLRSGELADPVDDPVVIAALAEARQEALAKLASRRAGARGEVDAPEQLVPAQLTVHKLDGGRAVGLRLEGPAVPSGSDADWSTGTVAPVVPLADAPEWMGDALSVVDPGLGLPADADAARRAVAAWMLASPQPPASEEDAVKDE